jgi:hypothetical protein
MTRTRVLIAGVLFAAGVTTAFPDTPNRDPIEPFEFESNCLAAGNRGMNRSQWAGYRCDGGYGAWHLYPTSDDRKPSAAGKAGADFLQHPAAAIGITE